jgi:hypothetical protein
MPELNPIKKGTVPFSGDAKTARFGILPQRLPTGVTVNAV